MKLKPITFILFILFGVELSAQTLKLIAVDSKQNKDTVSFGVTFSMNATTGVDVHLGERNLFGLSYDSLEIRSIQRDVLNHHCLIDQRWSYEKLYFNENLDMKIDYRFSTLDPWNPDPENRNFEFIVKGHHYPIFILGQSDTGTNYYSFKLLDSTCNITRENYAPLYYNMSDTIFVINSNLNNTIHFYIMEPAGVNSLEIEKFKVYPNPFTESLRIANDEYSYYEYEILSITGNTVYKSETLNNVSEPILTFLENGLYFLRITDSEKRIFVRKIIKN